MWERAAAEPETRSHSAAVSESQSAEHTPDTLMEMLCLLCRKGPARSHIQEVKKKTAKQEYWSFLLFQDTGSRSLLMERDVTALLMQRCSDHVCYVRVQVGLPTGEVV